MKNKKLMLIATAAMGFVALGAAGVGTAAWYAATTSVNGTAVAGTAQSSLTTAATPVETQNILVSIEMAAGENAIALSTSDAYTYGVVNNALVEATVTDGKYAVRLYESSALSVHFWENNEGSKGAEITGTDDRMKNLAGETLHFTITAGTRTKVAAYNATYDTDAYKMKAHSFDPTFGASVDVDVTLASDAGGVVANVATLSMAKVFYRITGNATDTAHGSATAVTEATASINGTLTSGAKA